MEENILALWISHSADVLLLARNLIAAIVIIIVGLTLSRGAQRLITRAGSANLYMKARVISILRSIVRYGIFIICVILILNIFGVNTTSLLAILGAAGLAVVLALKDTLGNIASGIIILFLGSCRIGDFVEFGSYSGTVKEINLFTTILETPDGIYISAPNSSIWGSPLRNYTRNGRRRMELSIGIGYADSVDQAFAVMQNIISAERRFLSDPPPQIILQAIEDNSVTITMRAWAAVEEYWNIYWDTNKIIKEQFEAAGLHTPLPQRYVHIVQD